jgi:hypothetical protein
MIKVGHGACLVEFGRHNRLKICRPKDVPVRVRQQAPLKIKGFLFVIMAYLMLRESLESYYYPVGTIDHINKTGQFSRVLNFILRFCENLAERTFPSA